MRFGLSAGDQTSFTFLLHQQCNCYNNCCNKKNSPAIFHFKKWYMKKGMLLFILPTLLLFNAQARTSKDACSHEKKQVGARVYFSNEIPINGIAKEGKLFYIQPSGNFLYVIVDNSPSSLNYSKLRVKIFKTGNLVTAKSDERVYDVDGSLSYTYIKYNFNDAGWYSFDVYSIEGDFIASGTVEIKFTSSNVSSTVDPYLNSRVYFSTEPPVNGIAKDVKAFKLKPGGGYIYVVVDNYPQAFNVKSLNVYVYKYVNGEYVKRDGAVYTMNAKTDFTWYKYDFYESGDYKFVVYDANDRYVNTGNVTITWSCNPPERR